MQIFADLFARQVAFVLNEGYVIRRGRLQSPFGTVERGEGLPYLLALFGQIVHRHSYASFRLVLDSR